MTGEIKDKFIQRFRTFVELKKYALKAPDPELIGKIKVSKLQLSVSETPERYSPCRSFFYIYFLFKIVETHNIHIPMHIERIKKQYCSDVDQAGNISRDSKSGTLGVVVLMGKWANH